MNTDVSQIIITTPMISELHTTLKHWVWCGFTGGLISGDARLGKTQAIRSLSDAIPDRNGDPIPICRVVYGKRDVKTIRSTYYRISKSIGKSYPKSATADDMLSDLLIYFADTAVKNQNRKVVVIVDEAQELTIEQMSVFAELYNELEEIGTHIAIFFVANRDRFKPLAEKILLQENRFIRERFFNYIHMFYGIRSLSELKQCLAIYDKTIVKTSGTTCTLTNYYCPKAHKTGFILQDIAEPLWTLWSDNYGNRFGYDSWGMTYFIRTISIILMDYFPIYFENSPDIIEDILSKSLEAAGNEPTLSTLYSHVS